VQVESGQHDLFTNTGSQNQGSSNSGIFTLEPGLIYRFPYGHITPFIHGLVGVADVDGPDHEPYTWGVGLTAGGGLDYCTGWMHHRLSIRLFQADYEYLHADSGVSHFNSSGAWVWGDDESINAVKLSTGVVLGGCQGGPPPPPLALACTASPVSIYPGDPVTVTATTAELDPKLNAIYSWSGTGVSGTGTTVTVATGSLAPGTYTVKGEVKEGKPGKEGLKVGQTANCSALFTVKAYEPPTVSCTANPMSIHPGDTSTVTALGVSPQNRPLTYSYSVVAGTINGSGTTATYNSTGAPTGAVGITCNVADDKGGTASNGTTVTIVPIPVPPLPHASALCSIQFDKDKLRPTRVDNEAKACLDQVTDALKNDPTATVVVVGESTAVEKTPKKGKHAKAPEEFAAERAVNTKDYLVNEEQSGIDASRIFVRTGTGDSKSVEDYLVPAGATFDNDVPGTTAPDVSAIKTVTRKPIGFVEPKKEHKKRAATEKPAAGK
jgi:outer membrane protein OmpA-like peptidoglycan-associated protein